MILGITSQNHDASMALIDGKEILWAAHSERYSKKKNDSLLNKDILKDLRTYGAPSQIVWFEKPWQKNIRRAWAGQSPWYIDPKIELKKLGLEKLPIDYVSHHKSHAAGGFYTSGFKDASVLVVDAIGEWDTVSIWQGNSRGLYPVWKQRYPNSMGLFYTAFTQYLGLKPNEEEYILMGMAAFGTPSIVDQLKNDFFVNFSGPDFKLKHNLHKGCRWWENKTKASHFDIAASVQSIMEEYLVETVAWMRNKLPSQNLVLMGGVALNCVANSKIAGLGYYDNVWIMPNPGDAGSAIGAVAAYTEKHLNWKTPYLGFNISRSLDIERIVKQLQAGKIVAVANGRAEFGPRALGNRSLLCDPRGPNAKARMNSLKKREEFRPFAPAILAEKAHEYFNMPVKESPYMQFVAECKAQDELPGICHVDGTSRVQTVNTHDNVNFRHLLEAWYAATGCPVLMNTSLNIKGEPLINSWYDALRWEKLNNTIVF